MATIPITLQSVLAAQNKVVTPSASPTAAANQAQLAANKAKAAERAANRQAIANPQSFDGGGFGSGVTQQEGDYISMGTAGAQYGVSSAQDYAAKYGNLYDAGGRLKTASTINNVRTSVPKTDLYTPPKIQTGKLVSDFNSTLKTTGSDKDAYYAGINYAGLTDEDKKRADTLFDMRQAAKKTSVATTAPVAPVNVFDAYSKGLDEGTKKIVAQLEKDRLAAIEGKDSSKNTLVTEYDSQIATDEANQAQFEAKQNELVSGYESNRLNQVQGDIRRALLARGVDISKIPQEQLMALSGEIGAKAFSDVFAAKEKATSAIENARQNKLARVNQLRMNKAITESQYKTDIANINSVANQAKLNADMKLKELVFGVAQAKKADTTSTDATTAQNRASILSTAGFTNTTTTPEVLAIFDSSASIGDAYNKLKRYIAANPELAKTLDSNLKSSGGGSLSDQLGLLNYQLNVTKTQQDAVNDSYNRDLKAAEATTGTTAQKNAAIQAVIQKYSGTASPTPVSGGA